MSDSCQGQVEAKVPEITGSLQEAGIHLRFLLRFCPLSCNRACVLVGGWCLPIYLIDLSCSSPSLCVQRSLEATMALDPAVRARTEERG